MDVVMLSRLQFYATSAFHFLFVPLTLGLSWIVAYMETRYVRTGDETYLAMTKFWGKIFLINFAVGVVTGITLEFQFGTNWSGYSAYVGDIFGSLLAIEATAAFFLESTFIGVWIFGWQKLSKKAHAGVAWLIAIGSNLSAVWILIANSWMQHPVGYTIRNGRAELTDFFAVITQKFAMLQIIHVLSSAILLAGFLIMGISAYHLLRKRNVAFFSRSFNLALIFGLIFGSGGGAVALAAGSPPDASFYPDKPAMGETHPNASLGLTDQAELQMSLVQERLREMEGLALAGKAPDQAAMIRLQTNLQRALRLLTQLPEDEMQDGLLQARQMLQQQEQVLAHTPSPAPEPAQEALRRASRLLNRACQEIDSGLEDPQAFRLRSSQQADQSGAGVPGGNPDCSEGDCEPAGDVRREGRRY